MIQIEVNGKNIEAREDDTILSALQREGIRIPTLCHIKGMLPSGACRICVVEVEGFGPLVPSCSYPVGNGMKIKTHSPRAVKARQTIVELLLANHPDDCLFYERNSSCELRELAAEYDVNQRRYVGKRNKHDLDVSNPSIVRDPEKCILCGKCVRICEEQQGVAAIDFVGRGSSATVGCAFDAGLNISSCVNCGQCIMVCPTGALREKSNIKEVVDALNDPEKFVVVQHAPAISVSLAEEFNLPPGQDVSGTMTAAFRSLGFDRVFDTAFTADLTIMEEASELVHRISNNGTLPMMTSCSPGWIKFVEQFYPDFIPNLSSCKSPQQMLGAVIKSAFAEKEGIDPKKIYSVSIMPCTAKKFETRRPEMGQDGVADIDAVLTTREFAKLIKQYGLDLKTMTPEPPDMPFGSRSTAGKLFAATGGVMEAALRTAHHMITGKELPLKTIDALRGLDDMKEARLKVGDLEVGVAVVSGLGNARKLLDEIRAGRKDIHFIEIMSCPGGCIAGGGQPFNNDLDSVRARMKALYNIDGTETIRTSHSNPAVMELYKDYLGEPLGEKSHKLLHTHYKKRDDIML